MPARGDFETVYLGWDGKQRVPCGGLDYTAPYNSLAQNSLAPGTVNTQTIDGVLCSSPAIANTPWDQTGVDGAMIGLFPFTYQDEQTGLIGTVTVVVTTLNVYVSQPNATILTATSTQVGRELLNHLYTWGYPADVNTNYLFAGQPLSWVQVENTVYFTSLALNGIYSIQYNSGGLYSFSFLQATAYVSASYLFLLDGYMCAAQCRFPGGGGTGTTVLPTIAWSVPGGYTTWDPLVNPQAGYNELPDVSDRITGVDTTGRSAFLMRLHGISQQDPNLGSNAGLQPFVWYHLWASPQGIGAYDNTVAQFGEVAMFLSSDNVYAISLSAGVQAVGQKIISKINTDALFLGGHLQPILTASGPLGYSFMPYYYFGSIVEIAGELHYLLTASWARTADYPPDLATSIPPGGYVYDLNMADNSWHFWDMSQYFCNTTSVQSLFFGFTTPIVQIKEIQATLVSNGAPNNIYGYSFNCYLFGGEFNGTPLIQPGAQFLPAAYDQQLQPSVYPLLTALLYPVVGLPQTTLVFRGETVMAGNKVTWRRMILQSDSVTVVAAQTSQLLNTAMVGSNQILNCPTVNVSPKTTGAPIQTYYLDGVMTDEMIQCTITSPPTGTTNWPTMATMRLTQVSFVGSDTTGTKQ